MKNLLFLSPLFLFLACTEQSVDKAQYTVERVDLSSTDPNNFYVNDGDSTQLFYLELKPKKQPKGVLVLIPSAGESVQGVFTQTQLHQQALENDFLVIVPSYNWGTVHRMPDVPFFDSVFQSVLERHSVNKDSFFLCGLSNGGVMALTYAIHANRDSSTVLVPRGIIGIDPPLDLIRFYNYCSREIDRNVSQIGVNEARWLQDVYRQTFGGTPDSIPETYQHYSVFTYGSDQGGNAQYLNSTPILMYIDLNTQFLLNERGRDLYDWNGSDIVAFVNQLRLNGNKQAQVVVSQNKGQRANGTVHPHSWNIAEAESTVQWMVEVIGQPEK